MSENNDIILTVSIGPLKNGKRKVVVSGAPEKEMPVIKIGTFPELHRLLDAVWVELQKRDPQVVTVKDKPKVAAKSKPKADKAPADEDESTEETETATPEEAAATAPAARTCRVCGCTDEHACEGGCTWVETDLCSKCVTPPAKALPVIEGDTIAPNDAQLSLEGLNG